MRTLLLIPELPFEPLNNNKFIYPAKEISKRQQAIGNRQQAIGNRH
jgi:hypothetical protein